MNNKEKKKRIKMSVKILQKFVSSLSENARHEFAVRLARNEICSLDEAKEVLDFLSTDGWDEILVETSAGLSPGCV